MQMQGINVQMQPQVMDPLAPFSQHQSFTIKQKKEMIEIFTDWESSNRYEIYDERGQIVLYALEETDACMRLCLGGQRAFTINIMDPATRQCIVLLKSDVDCCTQNVFIEAPAGTIIGQSYKEFAFFTPTIHVKDATGHTMFKIASSMRAAIGSMSDVKFKVKDAQDQEVARITKKYKGFFKEAFTDADTFTLEYQAPLNNILRAALLAVVFHVDMVFYERSSNN